VLPPQPPAPPPPPDPPRSPRLAPAAGIVQALVFKFRVKRQAEQLVRDSAQDFEDFYAARPDTAPPSTSAFLVMSVDQKGIVVRHQDLLPATQKQAAAGRKLETRFTRGETRARKRIIIVAATSSSPISAIRPASSRGFGTSSRLSL